MLTPGAVAARDAARQSKRAWCERKIHVKLQKLASRVTKGDGVALKN